MSFWPRLRKRGPRGRKRKQNPYAARDTDKYDVVQAEFEAQRAQFALEKGVPISFVRFISRSSRGWVSLSEGVSPPSSPRVSSPSEEELSLSPASRPLSPSDNSIEEDFSSDYPSHENAVDLNSAPGAAEERSNNSSGNAVRKLLVQLQHEQRIITKAAAVLFVKVSVFVRALGASTAIAFTIAVVVNSWNKGKSTFRGVFSSLATQLLTSLRPYLSSLVQQKESFPLLRNTASKKKASSPSPSPSASAPSSEMKVLPITDDNTADRREELRSSSFAFPVLTRDSSSSNSLSPIFPVSLPPIPPTIDSRAEPSSPIEEEPSAVAKEGRIGEVVSSAVPSTKVVVAPLVESNKLSTAPPPKPCQKLRAKLFKSSPTRKITPSQGENSKPREADLEGGVRSSSSPSSPSRSLTRSPFIQRKSNKGGNNNNEEEEDSTPSAKESSPGELEPQPKKGTRAQESLFFRSPKKEESSNESVGSPLKKNVTRSQELRFALRSLGKKKGSKSEELTSTASSSSSSLPSYSVELEQQLPELVLPLSSSPPTKEESRSEIESSSGKKYVSRSHELKLTLKSLGRKKGCKSHELISSPSLTPSTSNLEELQELVLPSSTVEGLQALAFPFKEEGPSSPQSRSPPKSPKKDIKRRNSLGRLLSLESTKEEKEVLAPSSPRMKVSKGQSSKQCFVDKFAGSSSPGHSASAQTEIKPALRKVNTTILSSSTSMAESQVAELRRVRVGSRSTPLPNQSGELGRSQVLSREILGCLLLLAVLGFLLLGRIPAILGTACFCLVLSHVQRFFVRNLTPRDKELLRRSSGMSRPVGGGSSPNWHAYGGGGSPLNDKDFQSSEYRKRVLMEGLLDRGNRRGTL